MIAVRERLEDHDRDVGADIGDEEAGVLTIVEVEVTDRGQDPQPGSVRSCSDRWRPHRAAAPGGPRP